VAQHIATVFYVISLLSNTMEEQTQVKYVPHEAVITELGKRQIKDYVQASKCIQGLQKCIIQPIETLVKEQGIEFTNEDGSIYLGSQTRTKKIKRSKKQLVETLEDLVQTSLIKNQDDIRCNGVKRFHGEVFIDSSYLAQKMSQWSEDVLGTRNEVKVEYEVPQEILELHKPRLIQVSQIQQNSANLNEHDVCLYAVADKTVQALKKKIITPFEKKAKESVEKNPFQTTFTKFVYGDSVIQVKTVPRDEPEYASVASSLMSFINQCMRGDEQVQSFIKKNTSLSIPQQYIHAQSLLNRIEVVKHEHKQIKYRQELSVLKDFKDVAYLLK
jgi:uncharacterized membrane-anchored protein YjiN (DUF445 family)